MNTVRVAVLAFLAIMACVGGAAPGAEARPLKRHRGNLECDVLSWRLEGAPISRGRAGEWQDLLLDEELVFVGRLISVTTDTSPSWIRDLSIVRCAVLRTWVGEAPDTIVEYRGLGWCAPGSTVLGAVRRGRAGSSPAPIWDGWSLRVKEDVALLVGSQSGCDQEDWQIDHRPMRLQDLRPDRGWPRDEFHRVVGKSAGLAVADVESASRRGSWWTMRCRDATWIAAGPDSLPGRFEVRVRATPYKPAPRRTLVPIPTGFHGGTVRLDCAARLLSVDAGYARALGIHLDRLAERLERDSRGRLRLTEPEWVRRD